MNSTLPYSATGKRYIIQHNNLPTGVYFCYRVSALNSAGATTSAPKCAAPAKPATPAGLHSNSANYDRQHKVRLWLPETSPRVWEWKYRIYYRQSHLTLWHLNREVAAPVSRTGAIYLEATNLYPEVDYCFQVTAYNHRGESGPSNVTCHSTDPKPPVDVAATNVTDDGAIIGFTDDSAIESGYRLQRSVWEEGVDSHWVTVHEWGPLNGQRVFYSDHGLEPETNYLYCVVLRTTANDDATSQCFQVMTKKTPPSEPPAKPNLAFAGPLWFAPTHPGAGDPFTLHWTTCNFGNASTGVFTDLASLDGQTGVARTVPALAPGACHESTVDVSGLAHGSHSWDVYLDANADVAESFENDNHNAYLFIID